MKKVNKRYSVLTDELDKCLICGSQQWIELHEVFYGKNRQLSINYGMVAPLCHSCHNEPPNGVHHNVVSDNKLKRYAQKKFSENFTEDFLIIFGKNYL